MVQFEKNERKNIMTNNSKKIASIIGIIVGVTIIIVGFSLQDTSNYSIGESIKFGADFYTEMYDVTKDVGRAINYAINDLICAIGWLIVSIGAIDICFFVYKLVKVRCEESNHTNSQHFTNENHNEAQASITIKDTPKPTNSETHTACVHKWICNNCKKLRTQSPCEYCGKD